MAGFKTCVQERYVNESDGGSRADNSSYNSYSQPTNINLPHGDNERYHRYERSFLLPILYFILIASFPQQPVCWVLPVEARHQLRLHSGIQLLQWQLLAGGFFLRLLHLERSSVTPMSMHVQERLSRLCVVPILCITCPNFTFQL